MKKIFYPFVFLMFITASSFAQSVAICGFDASGSTSGAGDEFSFALLRDFSAGERIYFTEDEYSDATNSFKTDLGEGHLVYTVPAGGLQKNEVIRIRENGVNTFTVQCLSGSTGTAVHLAASGTWSYSGSDELYAYSASNASAPWFSVTEIHCFYYGSVISATVDQDPQPDYPNVIKLAVNLNAVGPMNADFMDAARGNTTVTALQNTANWTKSTSDITLSCTNITTPTLPIELIQFDAYEKDSEVLLDWSTSTEINNAFFVIEHSIDGIHFEKIGQLDGLGNSELLNQYSFIHNSPTKGFNYYRLKQVDFNGDFEYSPIVSVKIRNENQEISIFPNPFDESIQIEIPFLDNNSIDPNALIISVHDVYGKLIHRVQAKPNGTIAKLDLSNLNAGTYIIQISDENQTFGTHRIMKF